MNLLDIKHFNKRQRVKYFTCLLIWMRERRHQSGYFESFTNLT